MFHVLKDRSKAMYWKAFVRANSIRSDEGLTLETSAFQYLYGGQFTLSTPLINQIILELNWCERFGNWEKQLNIFLQVFSSSKQLQNRSFWIDDRTRMLGKSAKRKMRGNRFSLLYESGCDVVVAVVFLVSSPNLRFCEERLKVKKYKPFHWIWSIYRCLCRERSGKLRPQREFEPWPLRWTPVFHIHGIIIDAHNSLLPVGPTAQLVVHCIGFFRGLGLNSRSSLKIPVLSRSIRGQTVTVYFSTNAENWRKSILKNCELRWHCEVMYEMFHILNCRFEIK